MDSAFGMVGLVIQTLADSQLQVSKLTSQVPENNPGEKVRGHCTRSLQLKAGSFPKTANEKGSLTLHYS